MEMIHLSKYSDNFSSNQHYSCRKFEIKSTMIRLVLKMYFNLRELGNEIKSPYIHYSNIPLIVRNLI